MPPTSVVDDVGKSLEAGAQTGIRDSGLSRLFDLSKGRG
jgi:hypothetical protein